MTISVEDTIKWMVKRLAKTKAILWNCSARLEPLAHPFLEGAAGGSGTASGPVSFMRGFDAFAGVVKSGGKTRRAAKMVILNAATPTSSSSSAASPTKRRRRGR